MVSELTFGDLDILNGYNFETVHDRDIINIDHLQGIMSELSIVWSKLTFGHLEKSDQNKSNHRSYSL